MNKLATVLATASLFALGACGGSSEAEVNNVTATDDLALPADENLAVGDTLADQANALDTTNAIDANAGADANAAVDANSADANAIGNVSNSQ